MNNKFKGLYDTEGTSFISDKVEPINYYEPAIKTPRIQNHTYSINFDKTELYKEIETLQQELQRKDNIINELKESINNFDVFKEFTFPLMKRDEEQQVISSIDYEWRKSIKEPFIDKIKELESK